MLRRDSPLQLTPAKRRGRTDPRFFCCCCVAGLQQPLVCTQHDRLMVRSKPVGCPGAERAERASSAFVSPVPMIRPWIAFLSFRCPPKQQTTLTRDNKPHQTTGKNRHSLPRFGKAVQRGSSSGRLNGNGGQSRLHPRKVRLLARTCCFGLAGAMHAKAAEGGGAHLQCEGDGHGYGVGFRLVGVGPEGGVWSCRGLGPETHVHVLLRRW